LFEIGAELLIDQYTEPTWSLTLRRADPLV
jgi:hypothetical protein